jgi:hypothetical protein
MAIPRRGTWPRSSRASPKTWASNLTWN